MRGWWQSCAISILAGRSTAQPAAARDLLHAMVADNVLDLPQPGTDTQSRYDALSALGEIDLTVARLAEAHVDALAILRELDGHQVRENGVWGVWAAEPPTARVTAEAESAATWRLNGRKAWASGARIATDALVTAHAPDGPRLFAVALNQPTVRVVGDAWPVPALSGTDTQSIDFRDAVGVPVGAPNGYVDRPGFWYGAAGVAAVWLGGASALGSRLVRASSERDFGEIDNAHLGATAAALAAGRSTLRIAATAFDTEPAHSTVRAEIVARTARAVVESTVREVIDHVGQALGPGPLALDPEHARLVTDLQLYVRQSHGARDLAVLGKQIAHVGGLQ